MSNTRDESFLARWSRRKAQAQAQAHAQPPATQDVEEETAAVANDLPPESVSTPAIPAIETASPAQAAATASDAQPEAEGEKPLTLEDVAKLTRDSDFTRFVARGVQPEVKNAALKKLFSDPHFNVMDGLDVYIDDYNVATPLPQNMLLKMAQAKFLGLLQEEAKELVANHLAPDAERKLDAVQDAANGESPPQALTAQDVDRNENADLQLQPHDAAGRDGAEPDPVQDERREH